jgi:hypothetical protein
MKTYQYPASPNSAKSPVPRAKDFTPNNFIS